MKKNVLPATVLISKAVLPAFRAILKIGDLFTLPTSSIAVTLFITIFAGDVVGTTILPAPSKKLKSLPICVGVFILSGKRAVVKLELVKPAY